MRIAAWIIAGTSVSALIGLLIFTFYCTDHGSEAMRVTWEPAHLGPRTIDFGDGVTGYWLGWRPDRDIPANAERYAGIADIEKCSLVLDHRNAKTGEPHQGCVTANRPGSRLIFGDQHPLWDVVNEEPLTLTPSVLCSCGWHGFITDGKWRSC